MLHQLNLRCLKDYEYIPGTKSSLKGAEVKKIFKYISVLPVSFYSVIVLHAN